MVETGDILCCFENHLSFSYHVKGWSKKSYFSKLTEKASSEFRNWSPREKRILFLTLLCQLTVKTEPFYNLCLIRHVPMFRSNLMPQSSEWTSKPHWLHRQRIPPPSSLISSLVWALHTLWYSADTHVPLSYLSGCWGSGSARRSYLTVEAADSSGMLPLPPYSSRKITQFNTKWKVWQCPKCETWSYNGGIINAGAISQNYMSSHSRRPYIECPKVMVK